MNNALHQERVWLAPAAALTLVSGVGALALIPSTSGLLPALSGNQPFVPPAPTVKIR